LATEAVHINMVNVHAHDPLIADVLRRFVDLLQTTLPERPALCRPTAALFLSSPGACTHYHVDREQNFLLHIRGKKTVHVFAGRDTLAVEMVKACSRKGRRIHGRYRPDLEREARLFQMVPETTLYIPRLWPHWVDNGDEISVSLSLNCFTASDMRRERVYTAHEWVADLAARVARRARLGRPGAPD
jgi:ribosomal protein L16 Arg81 hydroxylase